MGNKETDIECSILPADSWALDLSPLDDVSRQPNQTPPPPLVNHTVSRHPYDLCATYVSALSVLSPYMFLRFRTYILYIHLLEILQSMKHTGQTATTCVRDDIRNAYAFPIGFNHQPPIH